MGVGSGGWGGGGITDSAGVTILAIEKGCFNGKFTSDEKRQVTSTAH